MHATIVEPLMHEENCQRVYPMVMLRHYSSAERLYDLERSMQMCCFDSMKGEDMDVGVNSTDHKGHIRKGYRAAKK